jgi:Cu/Ag efflux protein CusF
MAIALTAALLPGVALSSPAFDESAAAKRETVLTRVQSAAVTRRSTETLRGVVDGIDQRNDTIEIRLSPETKETFKVQDGLIFNAVRHGDQVEVTVESIGGVKTIVGLR